MSAEDAIQELKSLDFKEVNNLCSKHGLNVRVDDYLQKKFGTSLKTAYLLITQPIETAVSRQTKFDSLQALRDVKKVIDSIHLKTKDQKFKNYAENLNQIMAHSKLK